MDNKYRRYLGIGLGLSAVFLVSVVLVAATPETEKPSAYAPAKELHGQLGQYVQKISEDLADEAGYGDEQRDRVRKDASTVAAVAMVLGMHDQDNEIKPAASGIITSARKLSDNAKDFKLATAALAELKNALQGKEGRKLEWEPAGDLAQLMKQVPVVNNNLRRNVTGRRFSQSADASAGLSATLAAIAQVSRFDDVYCSDADEKAKWEKVCLEMRDASAEVLAAVRKGDQKGATTGLDKLAKTCDACHHDFRD